MYDTLQKWGHELEVAEIRSVVFGGGQIVQGLEVGYVAASDSRRDGQAVGF